ncbi:sugar phosphate isomerase/epimerase family protein [Companilactobacillus zhachilii]|uniref:sugar phosphate isomerase/epimerase family protein n=1 Tax=Companilactobacillus zhachilii TaxID=2304606 RepID=UPI0040343B01
MRVATQNQDFFPEDLVKKMKYIKSLGFDGYEIDGKLLVDNVEEVKKAIKESGIPVTTACGGYDGWIGDYVAEKRYNGIHQIAKILEALHEVGGNGIIVPASWSMHSNRLLPMKSPRSPEWDFKEVSESLKYLDKIAGETKTKVYLEPLCSYQDYMINLLADSRRYIDENNLKNVEIIADFYHMNMEEDDMAEPLHEQKDKLGHVHIADNQRYQPGSGQMDYVKPFTQLYKDGYKNWIVYECRVRSNNPEKAYKDSLKFIRTELDESKEIALVNN